MADPVRALADIFVATQSNDNAVQRPASVYLRDSEGTPGFVVALLQLAGDAAYSLAIRTQAAALFRNIVKRNWNEAEASVITEEERAMVREHLLALMCTVPAGVQRQLSDALAIISRRDYPEKWPSLVRDLVARLAEPDIAVLLGVLETAAAVFSRFRDQQDSDELRMVLLECLGTFAEPLLQLVIAFTTQVQAAAAAATTAAAAKATLEPQLQVLAACTGIFAALSSIEFPAVFEDRLKEWMGFLRYFLTFSHPFLAVDPEEELAGPLQKLQGSILEFITLCQDRYDDVFEPYFPDFAADVWTLLSETPAAQLQAPCMDAVVQRAMRFLTACMGSALHNDFFRMTGALGAMTDKIVVPNIMLRPGEVVVFAENAIDFIRSDIEGSDTDTRRHAATDMVRAMTRNFSDLATPAVLGHIDAQLAAYAANPEAEELRKDAAIALLIAVAVKTQTAIAGALEVHEGVDIMSYLSTHVIPELSATDVDSRPIARAACIKFLAVFRSQFTREQLTAVLGIVAPFIGATSFVVHTYAASVVERVLMVREVASGAVGTAAVIAAAAAAAGGVAAPGASGGVGSKAPRLQVEDVVPHVVPLLTALFAHMTSTGYPQNDYLMKTTMRLVAFTKDAIAEVAPLIIDSLSSILTAVCSNPTNPSFNHFLFETIAAVQRFVGGAKPDTVAAFEGMLMPNVDMLLKNDVSEFLPYAFQLLAQLLELYPAPGPGGSSLSEGFIRLLPTATLAKLWTKPGNVPALTMLVQAYMRRGFGYLSTHRDQLLNVLGVWQNVLAMKNLEDNAFAIADAMFEAGQSEVIAEYLPTMFQMMLQRLAESKQLKLARCFVHTVAMLAGFHGGGAVEAPLTSMGPLMLKQVLQDVVAATANKLVGRMVRREAAVGLTRVLTEIPSLLTDASNHALYLSLLDTIAKLADPALLAEADVASLGATAFTDSDPLDTMEETTAAEYTAAFSPLVFVVNRDRYAFGHLPEAKVFLAQALATQAAASPGVLPTLLGSASGAVATAIAGYAAAAGVAIV